VVYTVVVGVEVVTVVLLELVMVLVEVVVIAMDTLQDTVVGYDELPGAANKARPGACFGLVRFSIAARAPWKLRAFLAPGYPATEAIGVKPAGVGTVVVPPIVVVTSTSNVATAVVVTGIVDVT